MNAGRDRRPEDREALERAMAGVAPLGGPERVAPAPGKPPPRVHARGASGREPRPLAGFLPEGDVEEHSQRFAADLGRGPLRELTARPLRIALEIDLHGMTRAEALRVLEAKLDRAIETGIRVVRVVHGRGLHSEAGPVLRGAVRRWLETGRIAPEVAAYRDAPPELGGRGATLVALRRRKRRGP